MPRKWVYRIGVFVIFFAVFQPPATYLIFGKIEKGRVIEVVYEYSGISLLPATSYPRIMFKYQDKAYIIIGEENQTFLVGDEVKVIFLKDRPQKAKELSFDGLFLNTIIQLPIGLLIWWALFKSFPNLFEPKIEPQSNEYQIPNRRVRKKEVKISEAPFPARILIYSLIVVVVWSLLYALWVIFKETITEKISYQTGIGISAVILIILSSIIHKVHNG